MKKTILICLLVGLSSNLFAFDGDRKGFIFGGGIGGSYYDFSQTIENDYTSVTGDSETGTAFATDFLIGYAPNNKTAIYYSNIVSWFKMKNVYNDNVTIASALTGLGFSHHFVSESKWSPNLFLTGSIGIAAWILPYEDDADTWTGFGWSVGIGYEFSKHYSILCSMKMGSPETTEDDITATTDFLSIDLILAAIAY